MSKIWVVFVRPPAHTSIVFLESVDRLINCLFSNISSVMLSMKSLLGETTIKTSVCDNLIACGKRKLRCW